MPSSHNETDKDNKVGHNQYWVDRELLLWVLTCLVLSCLAIKILSPKYMKRISGLKVLICISLKFMSKGVKTEMVDFLLILEEEEMILIFQEEQGQAHNSRVLPYDLGNRIKELLAEETTRCSKPTN